MTFETMLRAIISLVIALLFCIFRLENKKEKLKKANEEIERQEKVNRKLSVIINSVTEQKERENEIETKYEEKENKVPKTETPLSDDIARVANEFFNELHNKQGNNN